MHCKECGTAYENKNGQYCLSCGVKRGTGDKFCSNCGAQKKNPNQDICLSCGIELDKKTNKKLPTNDSPKKTLTNESQKLRIVSLLLLIFLGPLGAHRFYAGKYKSAVAIVVAYPILGIIHIIATISEVARNSPWMPIRTFITGLSFIIVLIVLFVDFVMILCGTFKDKDGNKISKWS